MGLRSGVPQGSNLGPLLYLVYVYDTRSSLRQGRLKHDADDTTLCINENCNSELGMTTFPELNDVSKHFNNLSLNTYPSKSSFIQIRLLETVSDYSPTMIL